MRKLNELVAAEICRKVTFSKRLTQYNITRICFKKKRKIQKCWQYHICCGTFSKNNEISAADGEIQNCDKTAKSEIKPVLNGRE